MKKNVLLFVFDGFADWEASYALVGINKSDVYQVKTIAVDLAPTESMGGITVLPDLDFLPESDLRDLDPSNTALLILPGGAAWVEGGNQEVADLVRHCVDQGIPVAAICGATIFLARLGLLNDVNHTSNDLGYLTALAPGYCGSRLYRNQPSIHDQGIITASGTGAVEFAGNIFEALDISTHEAVIGWFQYFEKAEMR